MINTSADTENLSGLKRADFQTTVNGRETDLFILRNENGLEVAVTNYGGAILSIMAPDRNGTFANVIQGHDSIDHVINSHEPFLNTLIGRYANRIAKGRFVLGENEYTLAINNGPNALHGGPTGFHARVWDAEMHDSSCLKLHYHSEDGEEGYPGNLEVNVQYILSEDNELKIAYTAKTDKTTIVSLTHHGFFNLAGIGNPTPGTENHILELNADFYLPIDSYSIPTGEVLKVAGTPMDFRTPHPVGSYIDEPFEQLKFGAGYDHCYVLNKRHAGMLGYVGKCVEPVSGRSMEVRTTAPGVQLYTANWHNGFEGAHGATFPARSAICLEAQLFPDSPNKGHFPSCVLRPEDTYTQVTIYKFGVEK